MFMIISSTPTHSEVEVELLESNITTSRSSLRNMLDYVFGSPVGKLKAKFAGKGIPAVNGSLSANGGDNKIDLTFTVSNIGGFDSTVIAEYWEDTGQVSGMGGNYASLGVITSSGQKTMTLGNLEGDKSYGVRVTAFNKFNNSGNYPSAPNVSAHWEFTETKTVSVSNSTSDPQIFFTSSSGFDSGSLWSCEWEEQGSAYITGFETRVDGGSWNGTGVSRSDFSYSNGTYSANGSTNPFPLSGDTVELRAVVSNSDRIYVDSTIA